MKTTLAEMNLESGIDISDVVDRDKFEILMRPDLFKDLIKISAHLASSDKRTRGINSETIPLKRDDISTRLLFFFEEKGF
jgi:hypothetical protein